MGLPFLARSPGSNPGVDVGISRELTATKLVTHTTKLNIGNPTDSLETQSIKVLYKNIDNIDINCTRPYASKGERSVILLMVLKAG